MDRPFQIESSPITLHSPLPSNKPSCLHRLSTSTNQIEVDQVTRVPWPSPASSASSSKSIISVHRHQIHSSNDMFLDTLDQVMMSPESMAAGELYTAANRITQELQSSNMK
ncbi:hypothetical protein O5D80_008069 [Batrachochytrium dendrobatidis]|nr:hypothetical protein O5D80_008069 [Batrachochytrium dendrobatidis]